VDTVICPEESVTAHIHQLIDYPEALQVLEFADGRVSLIAVRAVSGGPMVRHVISELPQLVPGVPMRMVAIYRRDEDGQDRQVVCDGRTVIEPGDEVFVLAATRDIQHVLDALRRRDRPVRRVFIAGGGRIGLRLALVVHPAGDGAVGSLQVGIDRGFSAGHALGHLVARQTFGVGQHKHQVQVGLTEAQGLHGVIHLAGIERHDGHGRIATAWCGQAREGGLARVAQGAHFLLRAPPGPVFQPSLDPFNARHRFPLCCLAPP